MQPALVCGPPERRFCSPLLAGGQAQWKRPTVRHCLLAESAGVAVSLHPRKAPTVLREPPTAQGPPTVVHGHTATGAGDFWSENLHEGMTGLVARPSTPGSQPKASGAAMAGGAGSRREDWQMPCLEPPLPERRSTRRAAQRWGSPEMPMLLPAIGKVGPAAVAVEEEEQAAAVSRQLLLDRFQGSVEVDSIEGVDFFSFSSAEDLREFARSMDQLMGEQYREPRSPEGSAPSARSGVADDEWREADWAEGEPQSVVVLPRKTTDITKIKGWRRKAFTADHVADHEVADQAADQTTRWVMDQMNEQAWRTRQGDEEPGRPPPVPGGKVGSSAPGKQAPQPPAAPGGERALPKNVRGAFLSSSLDEFLEHRSELRVGQLARLNPNIVPPPQGQGVLALSAPPVVAPPAQAVGPTRAMTSHVPRRYGRAAPESPVATRSTRSEKPDGQRRPSAGASQAPKEEPASPSPKPAAKRAKVEAPEEAPFLAMTTRKLRGSSQAADSAPPPAPKEGPKEGPKESPKKEPEPKKAAPAPPLPPYGASAGSGDFPLVTETVLSNKQRELLQALLVSTQCSRPLTVALPAEPCFVCPQLDEGDALAAAGALRLPGEEEPRPPPTSLRSTRRRNEEEAAPSTAAQRVPAAKAVAAGTSGAKQQTPPVAAPTREPAAKAGPVEAAAKTPRKSSALPVSGTLASPPEAAQSTRSRRPIRLPARFQDSALYFSPNGDLFDVGLPVSPRQRARPSPAAASNAAAATVASPKVAAASRPPAPVPPAAEGPPSTSTSSWSASSSSSSSSSASSSRSSSPCEVCLPPMGPQGKQGPHLNGGKTLKQLSRLKTDGFVSLHKLDSRRPPSTSPDEGSVDVDIESISDSDSANHWMRPHPGKEKLDDKACRERQRRHEMFKLFLHLQNVAFRSPRSRPLSKICILGQASQYLRCLSILSAHLADEEEWQRQYQAALKAYLEAALKGSAPPRLPKLEPRPRPLPAFVAKVCDLSSPTLAPLREPLEETPAPSVPSPPRVIPVGSSKRHIACGKEKHSAKSGGAEQRPSSGLKDAVRAGPGEPPATTFKLDDGRIGALRSVPTAAQGPDLPRKYTLYPVKGTVLGDLSKVAAAAQHIIGPCVIKRVKLRSGQTVFVYRQPAADGTLPKEDGGRPPPPPEKAQEEKAAEQPPPDQPHQGENSSSSQGQSSSAQGSPASPRGSPETPAGSLESPQGSPEGPQDDAGLGETSEWVSGDGDTCIVMKLPVSSDEDEDSGSSSESSES
ncbi:uncharacterized protein LOC144174263 isoform X2 [Haemaphysalis longicornis]